MSTRKEEIEAFEEYEDKVGGQPIGLFVPDGYPEGVEEMGGVVAVYKQCIEQGITWEELLDYEAPDDDWIL